MAYPLTYIYLLAFVAMVTITTLVAALTAPGPHRQRATLLFALVTLWSLADLLSNLAVSAEQVRTLAFVFAPIWASAPPMAVETMSHYVDGPRWLRHPLTRLFLALTSIGCVALVWSGNLYTAHLPASANGHYFQSQPTAWQLAVMAQQLGCLFTAAAVLWTKARQDGVGPFLPSGRLMVQVIVPVVVLAVAFNSGLLPLSIHMPFTASPLLAFSFCVMGIGMLRRNYFVPVGAYRRERDQARDLLSRREQVLSAMPLGVAIAALDRPKLLYRNPTFDELLGLEAADVWLPQPLQARLSATPSSALAAGVELGWPVAGAGEHTLLVNEQAVTYAEQPARLITLRDVTAHKQVEAELEIKRSQLLHAQKLEAVGRLSVGIAHDFNNQLTAILGNTVAVADSLGPAHPARADLLDIQRAAERASVLTRQLLSFGRRQASRAELVELGQVLGESSRLFGRLLGERIALEVQAGDAPAWVQMDRVQLEQVLMTLVVNAYDAMPDGGRLRLAILRSAGRVELEVQDSGVGMAPEVLAHIFEPFFTTKGELGTGIGLTTAQALVAAAGGSIQVRSAPGQGSTFVLGFPLAEGPARATEPAASARAPVATRAASGERRAVLLVEDDEAVRRAVSRRLEQEGFAVLQADSATHARTLFDGSERSPELLLTDLGLPDLDGQQLARELRTRCPGLPVVIMTGHRLDPSSLDGEVQGFITKPFRPDELCEVVRRALDATASPRSVLLVEDEPALRHLLVRCFEADGWQVREAAGLHEALHALESGPLSAVVTDLGLGDGSGYQVLQAARARHPRIACLVTSGGSVETPPDPELASVPHLLKPYEPEQVLRALQDCDRSAARDGVPA